MRSACRRGARRPRTRRGRRRRRRPCRRPRSGRRRAPRRRRERRAWRPPALRGARRSTHCVGRDGSASPSRPRRPPGRAVRPPSASHPSGSGTKWEVLRLTTHCAGSHAFRPPTEKPHSQLPGTAHRIAEVRKLGQFAYRRRRGLTVVAGLVAVVSALGGASVFDNVKPFGFQDPDAESSRAYKELRDATGRRPVPEVELLVDPASGDPGPSSVRAAARLRRVFGIEQVLGPASDPRLYSDDHRAGVVLGFISADVTDISEVGDRVRERFSGYRGVTVGGAAVTVDELTKTTQDDLKRIELFALPLLLLLSFLVFRGLVAAMLPVIVGGLSILTTLLLLNALTKVVDIDTFAINIVTGLGLGLAIDYSLFLVTRFREELETSSRIEAAVSATMAAIGRMVVFSGLTVAVSLIALCIFPQRFLYSIGIGGALVALASAGVCLLFLPAFLALLGERVNALAPAALQGTPTGRRWFSLARFVLNRPAIVAFCAVAVMVIAGLPF